MKYVLQKSICKMVCLKSVVCLCRINIYLKIYLTFYWLSGIFLILISRLWHCVVKHCILTEKIKCTIHYFCTEFCPNLVYADFGQLELTDLVENHIVYKRFSL